jgi:hypothetical protein
MTDIKLVLIARSDTTNTFEILTNGIDVESWPDAVNGWADVLDCRTSPYKDQSLEDLCAFAKGVRKSYLLMSQPPNDLRS